MTRGCVLSYIQPYYILRQKVKILGLLVQRYIKLPSQIEHGAKRQFRLNLGYPSVMRVSCIPFIHVRAPAAQL